MKEINRLTKVCKIMNYNFYIQFWDGEFNVSIDDNNVQIDKEIACIGGCSELKSAIIQILKRIDK